MCCGFGLSFEQMLSRKGLGRSRIELLFDYYPHTYKKYIHDLKMIRPLCDAGIDLNVTDNIYKKYFIKRQRLIQS
ncbi:hypothetical protein FACS1894166_02720 [Bacilli bacterium]|nr:hypothetical protein FACS1894166_02720 [Bacilli bacterium]